MTKTPITKPLKHFGGAIFFALVFSVNPVLAHSGHVIVQAGHSHWLVAFAVLGACLILVSAMARKRKT